MDQVFVAHSVVEPLGRPIDSKAGHYRTVEQLLQAPIWRFGRCGLSLSTVSCLSAAETLAVVPRRVGHDSLAANSVVAADLGYG
jgi:hypothetical protein